MSTKTVWPKNDEMRAVLRHPTGGKFPAEGPATWPDDTFTYRRLQDGDVTEDTGQLQARTKLSSPE